MILHADDINRQKLTHLIADDLFYPEMKQVFHAKTGKFAGYLYNDQEYLLPEEPEAAAEPIPMKCKQQLELF